MSVTAKKAPVRQSLAVQEQSFTSEKRRPDSALSGAGSRANESRDGLNAGDRN